MEAILIVTHRRGFESDPVIDKLRKHGIEVFRFNCDQGENVSLASFWSEGNIIELVCDGRRICSEKIVAGWCQQLPSYLNQPANETEHLQSQNLWALHSVLFELLPIPWLNKPSFVSRASNKVLQITIARSVGLAVPDTLVSNHPDKIRVFAQRQTVVAKNLATPWIVRSDEMHAAYTRIVANDWLTDDDALAFSPVIYQQYHERRRDYRVILVGEKTFAACCQPNKHQREDIRKNAGTGESFVACEFNKDALGKLKLLMQELSLGYCAADFMEDMAGNLYFLEVNTCGAWWWLDRLYQGEISKAITDFLIHLAHFNSH